MTGPEFRAAWRAAGRPVFAAVFVLTVVLLAVAGPASTSWGSTQQPVPGTSTIGTPGGQCLTALDGHHADGTPVVLATCKQRPAQHWNVNTTTGTWRLHGTDEYVTVPASNPALTLVLGPASAATQFVYVNHRVAADGDWLTWKPGDREPFLRFAITRHQTWYVFLTICCKATSPR